MKQGLTILCVLFLLASCTPSSQISSSKSNGSTKKSLSVTGVSTDADYGVTEKKAIKVGDRSPANERAYLDQLAGPNGETISYTRTGSCCPFKTPNGFDGKGGLLDAYKVTWKGNKDGIVIYINMYDPPKEALLAPKGMTIK